MASTGEGWKLGHSSALDGLRGIAILAVLICHLTQTQTPAFVAAGPVGVTMFFTLSGFLITALLLEERAQTSAVSLRRFYSRRARRLFPALWTFVAIVALVGVTVRPDVVTLRDMGAALLYVGNWLPAQSDYLGVLNHTWSLAIEEQFYLAWPVAVIVVLRRAPESAVFAMAVGGVLASMMIKVVLWNDGVGADRVYFGSDTRADALLIGCALAVAVRRHPRGTARPGLATLLVVAMAVLGLLFSAPTGWRYLVLSTLVAGGTAGVIGCVVRGEYRGWLTARPLAWVGQRSYGLYLWHVLPVTIMPLFHWWLWAPLVLGSSLMLTVTSWRFVEQPFMRRRPPGALRSETGVMAARSLESGPEI